MNSINKGSQPEILLRPVTPDDRPFLFNLYAETRAEELALTNWNEAQRQAFLEMQFRAQEADYTRRFPDGQFSIITCSGSPIGRITIAREPDEIRVVDLIIAPEWRNNGLGTSLLKAVFQEAIESNKPVRLSVLKEDRAMRLYERLGFRVTKDLGLYEEMEWRPPD
jgi:ribosomal protein S18 acetylase RimI-like enzyme